MVNKRGFKLIFILFGVLFLFVILNSFIVFAANLNLKVTGTVNNLSSTIYMKTSTSSTSSVDSYDMGVNDLPSGNYSQFYSNISGTFLAVDSWSTNPRTLYLVYKLSNSQTGNLNFSWEQLTGDYDGTFMYYGNDSTYTTSLGSANMRASSVYAADLVSDANIYVIIIILDYSAPAETTTPSSGGGGGGGSTQETSPSLEIDTKEIQVPLVINTVKSRNIKISNPGGKILKVNLKLKGLSDILDLKETSFNLGANEKKDIELKFIGPEKPGIYTGELSINGKPVFISVNVNTKELLFDAGIVIPDTFKSINEGNKISSQINLVPMGENPRLDVTLNYVIKDFEGRTFLSESETLLVDGQKTFNKDFATQNLPEGNYVLGLELIYPNGVATSTSHFEIKSKAEVSSFNFNILIIGLGIGILILIIGIILQIRRYKNSRRFGNKTKKK